MSLASALHLRRARGHRTTGPIMGTAGDAPVAEPANPMPAASRAHCERALTMLHTHRGNPHGEVDRILGEYSDCAFGHRLRVALLVLAGDVTHRIALAASVAAIESAGSGASNRERRHAGAARAWLEAGAAGALEHYAAIVVEWPRDILALTVAHALDFRLGRRRMLRDRVAQVLPEWNARVPGYASVLAMYAFGLEENGQRRRAEATARRALALDPGHPGAIHVVTHVMEMQGRAREGLAWLAETEPSWAEGTGFGVHLAWHRAVFQLELDDLKSALATYDARLAPGSTSNASALVDASALLWRLALRNVDLGDRWHVLADRWEARLRPEAPTFQAVHALMAFTVASRDEASRRVLESLRGAGARATLASSPDEALAEPVGEAFVAFGRQDFERCVERLNQVRHLAHRCGGSLAQCDLIHLTLTEAALRARRSPLARALAAERAAQRPASILNRLLLYRAGRLMAAG
jgi:hypothetical protein